MRSVKTVPLTAVLQTSMILSACLAVACGSTGAESGEGEPSAPLFPSGVNGTSPMPSVIHPQATAIRLPIPSQEGVVDPPEDAAGDELRPKGFIGKTAQSPAEMFSWSTANKRITPDVDMRPTNSHICVLTKVGGDLGGVSAVTLHHNETNVSTRCERGDPTPAVASEDVGPTWKLGGCQKASNSLQAEATCVSGAHFSVPPGGIVTGSGMFTPPYAGGFQCPDVQSTQMWPGIAISFLSTVLGRFNGTGEAAEILPDPSPLNPTILQVRSKACGSPNTGVDAGGYSFFANVLDGLHTTLRSYTISLNTKKGVKTTRLAETRNALCYLTKISGDFNGSPERARIYPEIDSSGYEWWMLNVHADGGSAYATAECIAYNQDIILE